MARLRFIHTSDLQLGMTRHFLGEDGQARFHDSRLRAIERLGQLAIKHEAEFIVIAGDVFESNSLQPRVRERALEQLQRLPVPVYLLPGNHDPLEADSMFDRARDFHNVYVVRSAEPISVREGVEILGAPWFSKFPSGDLLYEALASVEPTQAIRIALAHGQVESFGADSGVGLIDLDYVEERVADSTIDYVALGDSHSTACVGSSERVWFSGSPETTDYAIFRGEEVSGERDSGNALLVSISKEGHEAEVEVEKLATGEWDFDAYHVQLYSRHDVESFLDTLRSYENKSRTCVRYALSGALDLSTTRYLEEELANLALSFCALYPWQRYDELALEPTDEELEHFDLGGIAGAALRELMEDVDNPLNKEAAKLLFRLSKENN